LARTNHESLKPSHGFADRLTIGGGNCLSTAISSQKVTFSHCVPTIIHMLVSSPVIKNLDLSRWKVVIGGSVLSQGLCKAGLENGINLYTAYGMSETCPLLTVANLKPHMLAWDVERQVEMRCRTGLPVPNVLLEVVDTEGNPLHHDGKTAGEVVVRAPWLTQGYSQDPEKERGAVGQRLAAHR